MNKLEIYINDQLVDLQEKDVVSITKQINDIAEIQKRQADFTNRFTILKTPNNIIIAEGLNLTGVSSQIPYHYQNARIIFNGIPIVQRGKAQITETKTRDAYDVVIYSGNYDLFSKIDGKYITELDWTEYNHTFDHYTWMDSLGNTEGYIYPLADTLGNKITNTPLGSMTRIDLNYQVPHVFVKTIWDKIFFEAGLEYYGDFFTDDLNFQNELVVADRNYLKEVNEYDTYSGNDYVDFFFEYDNGTTPVVPFYELRYGDGYSQTTTIPSTNFNTFTSVYTAPYSGKFEFNVKASIGATAFEFIDIIIKVGGVERYVKNIVAHAYFTSYELDQIVECQLAEGEQAEVLLRFYPAMTGGDISLSMDYLYLNIKQTKLFAIPYNGPINFSNYLPKVKQMDFLRAIMQQYGLVYQVRPDGRYEFNTIQNILMRSPGYNDFTDKYISETSETYTLGNYGLKDNFKYKYYDTDLIGDGYADSYFNINIDGLSTETSIIDSIIQAGGDVYIYDGWDKIASTYTYTNTEEDNTAIPIWVINDNKDLKTTMLVRDHFINVVQMFEDVTKTVIGNVYFYSSNFPVTQFKQLHWDVLKNTYYPKFIEMVQTPVKKKVYMWLTAIDVYQLDMFKVIYLNQYQSYFYLNKVNNFIPGKPSECELVKIY